jgi:hypothetical protein
MSASACALHTAGLVRILCRPFSKSNPAVSWEILNERRVTGQVVLRLLSIRPGAALNPISQQYRTVDELVTSAPRGPGPTRRSRRGPIRRSGNSPNLSYTAT